jgi:hypothetical protein
MIDKISVSLAARQVVHDTGIKSLLDARGNAFTIVTPGLGEIDVIFLNEAEKVIYVCECKNNRPRFDVFYWRSEQRQFAEKYEAQLARKHEWVAANKIRVQEHFNRKFGQRYDFSDWTVEGLFLLMTSSIYKYDGSFLVLTVEDLSSFLENGFVFRYPSLGFRHRGREEYVIHYPYFKNLHRMLQEGTL